MISSENVGLVHSNSRNNQHSITFLLFPAVTKHCDFLLQKSEQKCKGSPHYCVAKIINNIFPLFLHPKNLKNISIIYSTIIENSKNRIERGDRVAQSECLTSDYVWVF